jgi:hypothetical protein
MDQSVYASTHRIEKMMDALCAPGQAGAWRQDWTRIVVLILVVIILVVTAIKGWSLADVVAVVTAAGAVTAVAGDRRALA